MTTPVRGLGTAKENGWILLRDSESSYRDGGEETVYQLLRDARNVASDAEDAALHAADWPQRYHLSPTRANVLRGLALPTDAAVLEIGAGCGAITRYLGESCRLVDALEPVPLRARANRERNRDLANVQVFAGELQDVPAVPAYDVVVVVGVLEYVGAGSADLTPYRDFLAGAADRMVDGASLVIAIENKLGAKYLAGAPEDHTNRIFDSVEGYPYGAKARTFSRAELSDLLSATGLQPRTLIAMPDYKMTRAVFDPECLPPAARPLLHRLPQFPSPDWVVPRIPLTNERRLWRSLVEAGLAADTGNSLLMLAGKGKPSRLWPAGIGCVSFATGRRSAFTTRTEIDISGPEPVANRSVGPVNVGTATAADPEFTVAAAEYPVPLGDELIDSFTDPTDPMAAALLTGWVALLDRLPTDSRGKPFDLLPHRLVVDRDGQLQAPPAEWFSRSADRLAVLRRGILLFGVELAARGRLAGDWPGCRTLADAIGAIGALIGLPRSGDWVSVAVEAEADFIAATTIPEQGAYPATAVAHRRVLARDELLTALERPIDEPADVEQRLAAMRSRARVDVPSADVAAPADAAPADAVPVAVSPADGLAIATALAAVQTARAQEAETELRAIKATVSWRVTAPLRLIQAVRQQRRSSDTGSG